VARLRLSSVEPMDFSDDLLGLMANRRASPTTSRASANGSDRILRACTASIGRALCRPRLPGARSCPGRYRADVMVGFPGETRPISKRAAPSSPPALHLSAVFTYSERPGTPAATDPEQVRFRAQGAQPRAARAGRRGTWPSARAWWGRHFPGHPQPARHRLTGIT